MKTIFVILVVSLVHASVAKVAPATGPKTKPPPPWAKFIKDKSTTPIPEPDTPATVNVVFPEALFDEFLKQLTQHIIDSNASAVAPPPTPAKPVPITFSEFVKLKLATTPAPESTTQATQETILGEVYLDWVKRAVAEQSAADPLAVPAAPAPAAYPYGYPGLGGAFASSPFAAFNPFAAWKVQKAVAQAQIDAALATLNITTTPKPKKLKLKMLLPPGTLPAALGSYEVSA